MTSIHLYEHAIALTARDKPFVLAAVIDAQGSTPQGAGANALIEPTGKIWGTLGGGCLEAESRQRALQTLDHGTPEVFDLKLDEVTGWDDGLICGGQVRIFVNPNAQANTTAYEQALQAKAQQVSGVLATVISHPEHARGSVFWTPESDIATGPAFYESREAEVLDRIRQERAGILRSHEDSTRPFELYLEPVVSEPRLIIAGGGHIGQAVCRLAHLTGFAVTVIDDRPSFASAECHPDARATVCGDIAQGLTEMRYGPNTYVLIVTRGHRHDGAVLAACVHSEARYIGMIGSRRKSMLIRKSLIEEGHATREAMERVVSPIGLDIGAQSVEEIAISIVAQLIAVRRNGELEGPAKNYLPSVLKAP